MLPAPGRQRQARSQPASASRHHAMAWSGTAGVGPPPSGRRLYSAVTSRKCRKAAGAGPPLQCYLGTYHFRIHIIINHWLFCKVNYANYQQRTSTINLQIQSVCPSTTQWLWGRRVEGSSTGRPLVRRGKEAQLLMWEMDHGGASDQEHSVYVHTHTLSLSPSHFPFPSHFRSRCRSRFPSSLAPAPMLSPSFSLGEKNYKKSAPFPYPWLV